MYSQLKSLMLSDNTIRSNSKKLKKLKLSITSLYIFIQYLSPRVTFDFVSTNSIVFDCSMK